MFREVEEFEGIEGVEGDYLDFKPLNPFNLSHNSLQTWFAKSPSDGSRAPINKSVVDGVK